MFSIFKNKENEENTFGSYMFVLKTQKTLNSKNENSFQKTTRCSIFSKIVLEKKFLKRNETSPEFSDLRIDLG